MAEGDAPLRVGVLALQGAFREHRQAFERLGAEVREVRLPEQLDGLVGLVIPGGESTTMAKLMVHYGFDAAIPAFARAGGGLWGTCAGAIVMAAAIEHHPEQLRFGLIDMVVARNAYGRQVSSFETDLSVSGLTEPFRAVFIRAPRIVGFAGASEALAVYDGDAVAIADGAMVATVFHPELTGDDRFHALVLQRWRDAAATNGD